jgi:hypothetical protein
MFLGEEGLALLSTTPVQKPKKRNSSWAKQMILESIEPSPSPRPKPGVFFHMANNSCPEMDFNLEEEFDEQPL